MGNIVENETFVPAAHKGTFFSDWFCKSSIFDLLKVKEVQGDMFRVLGSFLCPLTDGAAENEAWKMTLNLHVTESVQFISHNVAFVNPEVLSQTHACSLGLQNRCIQAACKHQR